MAPYVAAVVFRSDPRRRLSGPWALDIGAGKDAGVLASDPTAILSLLGRAMSDPSLVYAAARKKRKGKTDPQLPDDIGALGQGVSTRQASVVRDIISLPSASLGDEDGDGGDDVGLGVCKTCCRRASVGGVLWEGVYLCH